MTPISVVEKQRYGIERITGAFLIILCALPLLRAADQPLFGRNVLYFDPGPIGSEVADGAMELNLDSMYSPEAGFGWTQFPRDVFARRQLQRSRTALTIDGVSGERIVFRADVAPAKWQLTLWLETGETDRHWPQILVNGVQQPLHWQSFQPSAEPSREPPKQFRVFHCMTSEDSASLRLEISSAHEPVRLLGISLIRQSTPAKPEHQAYLQQMEQLGDYKGAEPLDDLLQHAEASLATNPNDAFYAIWRLRLDLLTEAERYYSMRGWQWANEKTGLGISDRNPQAVMLLDGFLMASPRDTNPFTERALYFRGRLLYWLAKERGGAPEFASAAKDLNLLAKNHPDDNTLSMYTGKRIDSPDACDCLTPTVEAPDWSNAEREALCRLRLLIHWWVETRQNEHGELGGKFGDDVEMLRWWAPLCLAGDETALRGWKRLADGVWHSKHVVDGYSRDVRDVEHAAEFVADTTPLMLLYSDDPCYEQRLAFSARHFETLWTGTSTGGNRHFRSAWFSSSAVDTDGPKGRDVEYNTRAVQPLRYLAWRRPDPKLVRLLHEWSTAWADAAMRTDKGKPKGIIPPSIRFPDGAINGDGTKWYRSDMFWDFYEWRHYVGSLMLDQLLFTYTLTGDAHLLEPMFATLELIRSETSSLSQDKPNSPEEGSPAWAVEKLVRSTLFWNVVEQWRDMTGDPKWDDLIMQFGTAYGRYRISEDPQHLVNGLDVLLEDVRYNTPLRTTEAIYTDRVRVYGAELLKAMLTGDGIQHNLSPHFAITWQQTDADFTARVRRSGREHLDVQVFSHAPEDREVFMRVWALAPGSYELKFNSPGLTPQTQEVSHSEPGQRIKVTVPPRRLLNVTLQRTRK